MEKLSVDSSGGAAPRIIEIRGQRVLLDTDLAALYGVTTKRLNEQVRRNAGGFPAAFLLELSNQEVAALRSQIATLNAAVARIASIGLSPSPTTAPSWPPPPSTVREPRR